MIIKNWKEFLSDSKSKIKAVFTFIILILTLVVLSRFLLFVENRPGVILNDPVLNYFQPLDLSWLTFAVLYISILISLIHLVKHPNLLLLGIKAYILMIIFRITAMYFIPLDPPAGSIILVDPLVEIFGTGQSLTKDLFFSGHTATIFLLFLIIDNKLIKYILLAATILVGFFLIWQHVHYSIDVFCAPFFAWAAYKITYRLNKSKI